MEATPTVSEKRSTSPPCKELESQFDTVTEISAAEVIDEVPKECARNGAGGLTANDIHSTMVSSAAFNNGISLEVDLPIEKPQQTDELEEATNEPSWGGVEEPPVVAPSTPFVKRPRPPPENEAVDDIVQTMRSILMDL